MPPLPMRSSCTNLPGPALLHQTQQKRFEMALNAHTGHIRQARSHSQPVHFIPAMGVQRDSRASRFSRLSCLAANNDLTLSELRWGSHQFPLANCLFSVSPPCSLTPALMCCAGKPLMRLLPRRTLLRRQACVTPYRELIFLFLSLSVSVSASDLGL